MNMKIFSLVFRVFFKGVINSLLVIMVFLMNAFIDNKIGVREIDCGRSMKYKPCQRELLSGLLRMGQRLNFIIFLIL